jgi:hypothetical protein
MSVRNTQVSVRFNDALLDKAREKAGLPADTPMGAVLRFALAHLAQEDNPHDQLDSTRGWGSVSYRSRVAAQGQAA